MANDLVKRFVKKDGSQRISFYQMEYAENPRYMTDEPLHCEDWSRGYTIMTKQEKERMSSNAAALLRCLLGKYGNEKKIVKALKDNYKSDKHNAYDNGLAYDRSRREWVLYSWQPSWKDYQGNVYEAHWAEEWSYCINIYDVDLYNILDYVSDETIEFLAQNYMGDGVKIASYSFGYYGEISFDDDFDCDPEGIAWLEKDEFLKYSGCSEDYWKGKTFKEIEWLTDELEAWSNNDVYGFIVEDAVKYKTTRKCLSGNGEDEDYEETEWKEGDSCWGFYGEFDKALDWMFEEAGVKKAEFEEE